MVYGFLLISYRLCSLFWNPQHRGYWAVGSVVIDSGLSLGQAAQEITSGTDRLPDIASITAQPIGLLLRFC
jgi:hypothetical protein